MLDNPTSPEVGLHHQPPNNTGGTLLTIIIALVYFLSGTIIARRVYGIQSSNPESDRAKQELKNIWHGRNCYQNRNGTYYRPHRECDCPHRIEWLSLQARAEDASPTNPYLTLFFWPLMGYHKVLTSAPGSRAQAQRAREIASAQHDIQIAELRAKESALLDKELKALGRS